MVDSKLFFSMRPLHVQLVVADPDGEDVSALRDALRAAGHVVVSEEVARLPDGVLPGPDFVVTEGAALPAPETLAAAEKRHLRAVLRFARGNKRQAALSLGIARSTLLAKIRKYQLD
jgi:DNA-binding NtrC family response regulator